jgi:hypothetical protein
MIIKQHEYQDEEDQVNFEENQCTKRNRKEQKGTTRCRKETKRKRPMNLKKRTYSF